MQKYLLLLLALAIGGSVAAQQPAATTYRATVHKTNDLVHTRLDVRFDYARRYLYGKAELTLKPHGTATDSLLLDAQGMEIRSVGTRNEKLGVPEALFSLPFAYDKRTLKIGLERRVPAGEPYTVYIDYIAKPDELGAKGSAAIGDAKGLYFINPDSAIAGKPVQIWT